jgi:N-acetylmuramoyl-L-alanine amidase
MPRLFLFRLCNLLLAALLVVSLFLTGAGVQTVQASVSAAPLAGSLSGKKVTLDPGHGWLSAPGAVSRELKEKDVALDIAVRVKAMLEGYGAAVSMTRTGDEPNADLTQAAVRANQFGADIVVSIHANAGGGTGTESCYQVRKSTTPDSIRLGNALSTSVAAKFGFPNRGDFPEDDGGRCARQNTTGWTQIYIHNMNPVTALIETAFIDGPEATDYNILKNRREEMAQAITTGIFKYFGINPEISCPTISEWKGEYYNNRGLSGSPALCRNDGAINFTWNDGGPGGGVGNDNFSARWTRTLSFSAGRYRFHVVADDGIRMWLDGNLIIDQWKDQGATEYTADRDLAAGNHTVKVEYYENGGGAVAKAWWEALGTSCPTISEWKGEYYNNRGLSGNPVLCRNDGAINFTWNDGGPGGGVGNDNFSARWTRTLSFSAGRYRFHVVADDGIRMWVDGNLIIDQWKDQGATEYTADRDLAAGNHTVKVEYYENGGGAVAKAWWETLGTSCPTISEWKGEYYNNRGLSGNPVLCRNDGAINFTWNDGGPGGGVGNDNFSARWTRTLSFSAGRYRFHVVADDGIRMWLDGNLIIDQWKDQGATEYTADRDLAGGNHTVKVEYYENGGGAVAKAWWEALGTSCPTISEWKGEYYNNRGLSGNPVLCRNDGAINFTWNDGGPGGGVGNDNFSARWTRTLSFSAGRYRFHVVADDGIRMWLDGNLIIDQWKDQGATEYTADRDLAAGNHTVKVEYYENGGGAVAKAWWEVIGTSCPTLSEWKGEYYNNRGLSGNPVLCRNDGAINFTWNDGGPGGGIGNDNFSARWTRTLSFSAGRYRFHVVADDGIRMWLDGNLIIDQWKDQGATEYTADRDLAGGNHTVKVEYYENGGGAVAKAWWEVIGANCPDQYKAEYFNNRTLSGSATLVQCEGWPINHDWSGGGPGGGVGTDNFSARWTGRANFSAGNYTFIARADDGIRVYLDNQIVIDAWRDQGPTEYRQTRTVSAGAHDVRIEYYENGGGAVAQFRWEQASGPSGNLALRKAASATSQESGSYPPANGNDGNNSTRWSSRNAADVGQEWWWVDLGSSQTFNRVVINWEAAYAANYFLCWSDNTSTCSGFSYSISSAGSKTHDLGARTARYVWLRMDTRAPRMNNYSFFELEVYRDAGLMDSELQDVADESAEMEVDISAVLPDVPDGQIEIEQP